MGNDDGDLGGHGEKCGHPKRDSRRDSVLVEPETHLIIKELGEAKSVAIYEKEFSGKCKLFNVFDPF